MIKAKQLLAGVLSAAMVVTSAGVTTLSSTVAVMAEEAYTYTVTSEIPPQNYRELRYQDENIAGLDEIEVTDGTNSYTLYKDVDYTMTLSSYDVGPATIYFTIPNDPAQTEYFGKTIAPASIEIVEDPVYWIRNEIPEELEYKASPITNDDLVPYVKAYLDRELLDKSAFTIEVTPPAQAKGDQGEEYAYKITINGTEVTEEGTVTIVPRDLWYCDVTGVLSESLVYDGTEKKGYDKSKWTITVEGEDGFTATLKAVDYEIDYDYGNYTNAGTHYATIIGSGNYTGENDVSYEIAKAEIGPETVIIVNNPKTDLFYTGAEQAMPEFTKGRQGDEDRKDVEVHFEDKLFSPMLDPDDYDIVLANGPLKDAGTYSITIEPSESDNYDIVGAVKAKEAIVINKTNLTPALDAPYTITYELEDTTIGNDIVANGDFTLTLSSTEDAFEAYELVYGTDFTAEYVTDHHDLIGGVNQIKFTGTGNFTGTLTTDEFETTAARFGLGPDEDFVSAYAVTYNGNAWTPDNNTLGVLTGKDRYGNIFDIQPTDYVIVDGSYDDEIESGAAINAGTATVEIRGQGKYSDNYATVEFTINPVNIDGLTGDIYSIDAGDYRVGDELTSIDPFGLDVKIGGTPTTIEFPAAGVDGTVIAKTIKDSILEEVTVTVSGNYVGTVTAVPYTSSAKTQKVPSVLTNLAECTITGTGSVEGEEYLPAGLKDYSTDKYFGKYVVVKDANGRIVGTDSYTISNIELAGGTTLGALDSKIKFRINYVNGTGTFGYQDKVLTIGQRSITALLEDAELSQDEFVYDGTEHKPTVTITNDEVTALKKDVDFEVTYYDNINAGEAVAVIEGIGNYCGEFAIGFTIDRAVLTADMLNVITDHIDRQFAICEDGWDILDRYGFPEIEAKGSYGLVIEEDYLIFLTRGQSVKATDDAKTKEIFYTIVPIGANYYTGRDYVFEVSFKLTQRKIRNTDEDVFFWPQNVALAYDSSCATVADYDMTSLEDVIVEVGEQELELGRDYTITLKGTNKVGTTDAFAEFNFIGNYSGLLNRQIFIEAPFDIWDIDLRMPKFSARVYSGEEIKPIVNNEGTQDLVEGTHYIIKYYRFADWFVDEDEEIGPELESAPVNVGLYVAVVYATAAFGGEQGDVLVYSINPKLLTAATFAQYYEDLALIYNPVKATAGWGDFIAKSENLDDLEYAGYDAGEGVVYVIPNLGADGNYTYRGDAAEVPYETAYEVTIDDYFIEDQYYTGHAIEPSDVSVLIGSEAKPEWAYVEYCGGSNVDVSEKTAYAHVVVEIPEDEEYFYAMPDDELEGDIFYAIRPAEIAEQSFEEIAPVTYNGKQHKPEVVIHNAKTYKTLSLGEDYLITGYGPNVEPGIGTVTVEGVGNFTGEATIEFEIGKIPTTVTIEDKPNEVYTGSAIGYDESDVTVTPEGSTGEITFKYYLENENEGVDEAPTDVGKYTVIATLAEDDYYASAEGTAELTINPAELTDSNVTVEESVDCSDGPVEPNVTVRFAGGLLTEDVHYTVEFKNYDKPGTGTATVKGIGNFTGTVEKSFTVTNTARQLVNEEAAIALAEADQITVEEGYPEENVKEVQEAAQALAKAAEDEAPVEEIEELIDALYDAIDDAEDAKAATDKEAAKERAEESIEEAAEVLEDAEVPESAKEDVREAVAELMGVMDDEESTAQDIMDAKAALDDAIEAAEEAKDAKKAKEEAQADALVTVIEAATIIADESYPQAARDELKAAVDELVKVAASDESTALDIYAEILAVQFEMAQAEDAKEAAEARAEAVADAEIAKTAAESMTADGADCTEANKEKISAAVAALDAVIADETSTADQINAATAELLDTIADVVIEQSKRAEVTLNDYVIDAQIYDGTALTPLPRVALLGSHVSTDWIKVNYYDSNVNVSKETAKANVTITVPAGNDYYKPATIEGFITFEIQAAELEKQYISVADATYTGDFVQPKVTILNGEGIELTEGKDYQILGYSNNIEPGTGNVILYGVGNYTGYVTAEFNILKAESTITVADKKVRYDGSIVESKPAEVVGSTGKVSYAYYADADCTEAIQAPVNAGTYYVKATVAEDAHYLGATSEAAKIRIIKAKTVIKSVTPTKITASTKKDVSQQLTTTLSAGDGTRFKYTKNGGKKQLTVSKDGLVTVKAGLKAGTYTLRVKVGVYATDNYKSVTQLVDITVTVK